MQKTSLLTAIGALALASTATAQGFSYSDFSDWTGISPVGLTTQAGNVLRLQDNVAPAVSSDNRGAAWYEAPVHVVGGFETKFVYQMHMPSTTGGSDGLAFVIQNDLIAGSVPIVNGYPDGAGNKAIGRHASAAGFGLFQNPVTGDSVDNSLVIHLDTYLNGTWGDTNANHISVHTGGNVDNSQDEAMSLGRATPTTDLNDGNTHVISVVYVPGTLDVYLDGILELSVPYSFTTGGVWVDSGTPVGGLSLLGGTSAYVGFTSGAETDREYRDILTWKFYSVASTPGSAYCYGRSDQGNPCPCGNDNDGTSPLGGCQHDDSDAGARLDATGDASVTNDSLVLLGSRGPISNSTLFFQANNNLDGASVFLGDGIRCAGGGLIRLKVKTTDASGNADSSPVVISTRSAAFGHTISAGETLYYQWWIRDSNGSPCGDESNTSNGYMIAWVP